MQREHAYEAIKAILAAIDDDELPKASKIEQDGNRKVAWFGGLGHTIGSAMRNGEREPLIYRDKAARQAIELEAMCRIDAKDLNA